MPVVSLIVPFLRVVRRACEGHFEGHTVAHAVKHSSLDGVKVFDELVIGSFDHVAGCGVFDFEDAVGTRPPGMWFLQE